MSISFGGTFINPLILFAVLFVCFSIIYANFVFMAVAKGGSNGAMPPLPLGFKIELKRIKFPQFFLNLALFT